jgi:hypothetical protein
MAKYKVYHYDATRYINCFGRWVDSNTESPCKAPAFYEYSIVAYVEANNIEEVFALTNSIDSYWGENENVDEVGSKRKRSTSVGDIIADENGNKYICQPLGWSEYGEIA